MRSIPTFSIVTISRDAGTDLRRTVASVLRQTYAAIEYIVVDGASTDGSLGSLREFGGDGRLKIISEPDDGIADAMNKGIERGNGKLIIHLHAGDTLHAKDVLERVANSHRDVGWSWATGAVNMVDHDRNVVTRDVFPLRDGTRFDRPHRRSPINHQATFVHRQLFETNGLFDRRYRVSMDYDLWLRLLRSTVPYPLDFVVSDMLLGGVSATSRVRGALESIRARREQLERPVRGQRILDGLTITNRLALETIERTLPPRTLATLRRWRRLSKHGR